MTNYLAAWRYFSKSQILTAILAAFGVLWLVVEVGSFFSQSFSQGVKPLWWAFLLIGITAGLVFARPRLLASARIQGTDSHIEVRVCDMFSQKGDLIISSNTTFDTTIEDGTISARSSQGQYTIKFCNSVEQLDRDLDAALAGIPSIPRNKNDKPYGKLNEYEIGTVASVDCGGRRAYFVALAVFNSYRVASATRQDIWDSLPRIWEYIRTRGEFGPLCCPVLGSGRSRVNATRDELVR